MTKLCAICGKTRITGHNIQHRHGGKWELKAPKTKRVFKPNLRKVNLEVDGKVIKADVCMKCYKRLRKEQE